MNSLKELEEEITKCEKKLKLLKQKKIINYNFFKYFNISNIKLENLTVKAEYEYNAHALDQYGHDATAYLKVTFGNNEYLIIDYKEEQGEGTESRYMPTIYCDIKCSKKAKKLLFKDLENIDIDNYQNKEAYVEFRDIIENIVTG